MAADSSGEDAQWRDLVARIAAAPAGDEGPAPWPAREDLAPAPPEAPGDPVMGPLTRPGAGFFPGPAGDPGPLAGRRVPPGAGGTAAGDERQAGPEPGSAADRELAAGGPAAAGTQPAAGRGSPAHPDQDGRPGPAAPPRGGSCPGAAQPGPTASRPRIVRPASGPPPGTDDDHYVPPPPPPIPPLDPVAKGAWTALFGGPAYLLLAVLAGWAIPGWAAFLAIGAFIGGFATLVVRMGDQPPRDSGPDDGAVV